MLKYESVLISQVINDISKWEKGEFNGKKEYEIKANGKIYFYDSETGLIGNEKTAHIEEKQKELFDRIIERYFLVANLDPPTTVATLPATD